jgi:Helix-turn-helix domain
MDANIITLEDLQSFKAELIDAIQKLLTGRQPATLGRWLKSREVRRMLSVSPGTLQHLRVNGTLPYTKLGGVIFYDRQDIEKVLEQHKQNTSNATLDR